MPIYQEQYKFGLMYRNDDILKNIIKPITYRHSFTSKTLLIDFSLHRYRGGIGFSVDTKVLKSKLILKNDVSLHCRVLGKVLRG